MKNLVDMEYNELSELKNNVEKAMELAEKKKRERALIAAREVALEHGYELEELMGAPVRDGRSLVKPKYQDPENKENTWSGRGRQPRWVVEALKSGKNLEDMTV